MELAFYRVGNSKEYDRYTFDGMCMGAIKEKLSLLSDDELRIYNMDNEYDVSNFMCDYNDELLDGGWWCVVLGVWN